MPKYKAGDKVLVNGQLMTLGSWPDSDIGPFFATYTNNEGGEVQGTYWAGQVEVDGEPVHTSSNVQLVEAGSGVESIAGDVSAAAAEAAAELARQDAEAAEKAAVEAAAAAEAAKK